MNGDGDLRWKTATRSGSSWASLIVDATMQPEGSNENAAGGVQRIGQDGTALLASIQAAGRSLREFQAQSQAQADWLRELVAEVREHLRAAEARAEKVEVREREMRLWANATVEAAEERVQSVEERARVAEVWLARISDAVRAEFALRHEEGSPTDDQAAA